jgi:hypothetical protein
MELTIPASPAHLACLRQAARHALREVPTPIAEVLGWGGIIAQRTRCCGTPQRYRRTEAL